jgi:hypothetical protein
MADDRGQVVEGVRELRRAGCVAVPEPGIIRRDEVEPVGEPVKQVRYAGRCMGASVHIRGGQVGSSATGQEPQRHAAAAGMLTGNVHHGSFGLIIPNGPW